MSQSPSPPLSGGRGFYKEDQGRGFSKWKWAQSIPIRQVMVLCASSWFSHPGLRSSQLHITLAPRMKVSKSPGTGMLKGGGLYLLKLVPRILIHTCCSSISYILVKVSTCRNNVKRTVGWATISHHYNFPLLQLLRLNINIPSSVYVKEYFNLLKIGWTTTWIFYLFLLTKKNHRIQWPFLDYVKTYTKTCAELLWEVSQRW